MKNIFLLPLILLTSFLVGAQTEKTIFSIGIDPTLAISGAYDYDKSSVIDITFTALTQINNNEYGITAEFAALNPEYFSTGFIYNRKINILYSETIETLLGVEVIYLQRQFIRMRKEWFTYGANAETRVNLTDNLGFSLLLNYKRRPDLIQTYNGDKFKLSGFIKFNLTLY